VPARQRGDHGGVRPAGAGAARRPCGGTAFGVDEPAAELLASAYLASVRLCDQVGAVSVAFPSLSTGAFGYPLWEACQVSARALLAADPAVQQCFLVAFDIRTQKVWQRALAA
jgi:O-acetyl-ADP-ribose deacetylase